ncbi:hypothetical protein MTBBW1_2170011 [Desulfamplus magnetovallimortis]|uniref:Uncharacterized protein n=1 Tax=Desulfamplus magnetovallimortis TaxID=1246637 RepID=A0A1W1HCN9_9BACT|nr:hypothetical protein MTBBW1_2170011 [Desulfamplus magnetovallimortis]
MLPFTSQVKQQINFEVNFISKSDSCVFMDTSYTIVMPYNFHLCIAYTIKDMIVLIIKASCRYLNVKYLFLTHLNLFAKENIYR